MIKLSVIIPVYNVKEYLDQCMESVLQQECACDLEVILIDDGSTDGSELICDKYSFKDSRVKVIHKENGGLSSARNLGIDESSGDYIAFLDSDDFWMFDSLNCFIKTEQETHADIILGGVIQYHQRNKLYYKYPNNITIKLQDMTKEDAIKEILKPSNKFKWQVWKSFYKTELIKGNKLYFVDGLSFEDIEWNPKVFFMAKSIASFHQIFICYRIQREGSITIDPTKRIKRLQDMLQAVTSVTNFFHKVEINDDIKAAFFTNLSETYYYSFLRQTLLTDFTSVQLLKQQEFLLDYNQGKGSKIICFIRKMFGYSFTCLLLKSIGGIIFKLIYRFK